MAKQYDVLYRLLLLGDSGVGKTCLLCRFTDNEFLSQHVSTIGVDFKMKTLEIDGIKVRIQIWDTAGQERYQTITKQYYRRAQGIFLVYDITSTLSFQNVVKWASDMEEYAPQTVQKILIGNKSDEEHRRQVATEQGSKVRLSLDALAVQIGFQACQVLWDGFLGDKCPYQLQHQRVIHSVD
ncbi:ras-related protein Rab-15-like isoform X2 [Colossoma macropomum]|uniref:ras-related protein Rab-15-like isoform X2 n=1 Tax=Colossoma macropomum TaxID=42526 RepID=UPI0018653BCE|nr:ras-related protein Rab-15-like isoform X2 [Colossoma macropomum]